jgi:hypothetical protein
MIETVGMAGLPPPGPALLDKYFSFIMDCIKNPL